MTDRNAVKISDFGVARTMAAVPVYKKGCSKWAAPEVLKGRKEKSGWQTTRQTYSLSA